ncbi:AAA family ATPase [Selenihalanaerobacter shriftii]|uniref:Stage V sporulation protein K n=1 Tax=Selenihalanaerobacter shriftii TaxID=142842 RepID=A0A1T4M0L2_9FIRM|nr:AAA family ATPase [Selenihalanaerobacter shriftii]SJZ60298.1 stage V sporulation protein K [Selenihalanaerobacter shriftii]
MTKKEIINQLEAGKVSITKAFRLLNNQHVNHNNLALKSEIDSQTKTQKQIEDIKAELDALVGLNKIKTLVNELEAFVKIQQKRKNLNLATEPLVMHMIFKGNPGTGKTTVARIFGRLFKELGLLTKGHLNEVERADLVGEYIGHTAKKTKKAIDEALGGILFIDEAYSLARGGVRDFGKESIDALVKGMEDNRDNLVIILAGYPQEMESFLQTNPGLNSRFPIKVDFDDYTLEELIEIAELMLKKREYKLCKSAKHKLFRILSKARNEVGSEKGNARTVRNIIERAIRIQATRLIDNEKILREDLMTIQSEDLKKSF